MNKETKERYSNIENKKVLKEDTYEIAKDNFVLSHLHLRKIVGGLGIALPIVLIIASSINKGELLPSISHYYHSSMKIIFTGVLFMIAAFLWTSLGESEMEKWCNRIAAICASLVAILPTKNQEQFILKKDSTYTSSQLEQFTCYSSPKGEFVGNFHFIAAAVFFACLIFLILKIFLPNEKKSKVPNFAHILVYNITGYGMIFSMLVIIVAKILKINSTSWPITFIFEFIMLILFGIAWIVKGQEQNLTLKKNNFIPTPTR